MSYPYQYTDNLSSSAVPFESTSQQINSPWSVTSSGNFEDIQAQMGVTAALYSQDFTTQQQLHVGTSSLQTSAPDSDASATSPTQTQVYEPPRVIQLVERRPRRIQQNQQSAKGRIRDQHPGASMNKRNSESVNPPVPRPTQPETQNQYSQASPSAEPQTGWFNMLDMSRAKSHGLVQRPTSTICETRNSTHPYYRPSGCGFSTIDTSKQKGKEVSNSPNEAQPSSSKSSASVQSKTEGADIKLPRYYVTTDIFFDGNDNTFNATLELPGVKKSQIRLSMAMHPKTNVPLLIVCGYSRPLFPNGTHIPFSSNFCKAGYDQQEKKGFLVRERRSGVFVRKLVLASGTKLTDIKSTFYDGILYLKYPAHNLKPEKNGSGSASTSTSNK